jgi:hypothetical protein
VRFVVSILIVAVLLVASSVQACGVSVGAIAVAPSVMADPNVGVACNCAQAAAVVPQVQYVQPQVVQSYAVAPLVQTYAVPFAVATPFYASPFAVGYGGFGFRAFGFRGVGFGVPRLGFRAGLRLGRRGY